MNELFASPIVAQVRIMLGSDGAIGVSAPLEDAKWCLKALAAAEEAVQQHRVDLDLPRLGAELGTAIDLRAPFEATTTAAERTVVAEVLISLRADGGLETYGPIDDSAWTLEMIRRGMEAVQHYRTHRRLPILPASDAALPSYRPGADRPRLAPREEHAGASRVLGAVSGVEVEYGEEEA